MGWGEAKLLRPQSLKTTKKWYVDLIKTPKTNICSSQDNIKKVKRHKLYVVKLFKTSIQNIKQSTQLKNIHLFVKKNQTI